MKQSSVFDTNSNPPADDAVGASGRLLDVLEFLERNAEPQSLTQIVRGLEVPKASAHRLLTTLRSRGYVEQSRPRGGYALGLRLLPLAARARERMSLVSVAETHLRRLAEETGEACQVSVRSGGTALCVARVPSPGHPDVSVAGQIGSVFPLHGVAVGKVLLAFAPEREQQRYLAEKLTAFTARTETQASAIAVELAEIRQAGIARESEEYKRGLSAIASPLFDQDGVVHAALALPFLAGATAASPAEIEFNERAVRSAAAALSRALGYRGAFGSEGERMKL